MVMKLFRTPLADRENPTLVAHREHRFGFPFGTVKGGVPMPVRKILIPISY
jgi:hypothetical protein